MLPDVEVLVKAGGPPTVRVPDIIVTRSFTTLAGGIIDRHSLSRVVYRAWAGGIVKSVIPGSWVRTLAPVTPRAVVARDADL